MTAKPEEKVLREFHIVAKLYFNFTWYSFLICFLFLEIGLALFLKSHLFQKETQVAAGQ
jgi:hypothetical protein